MKRTVLVLVCCAVLGGGVWFLLRDSGLPTKPELLEPEKAAVQTAASAEQTPVRPPLASPASAELPAPAVSSGPGESLPSPVPMAVAKATKPSVVPQPRKKQILDPVAREALAWVGSDTEAEVYWYSAINDPSLPPNERQDLIEDLNEDGLSNPSHPTIQDLPLILSRIDLIENLGPEAMDPVNAAAFQEAYKDLVNLARVAAGMGSAE